MGLSFPFSQNNKSLAHHLVQAMKPVRLPASATLAFPRWGLLLLLLLYILPGLLGRDPWKNDDAASFGIMWTMAHGSLQDWLVPNIVGQAVIEEGPLAFWIGALCIKLFGWLLGDALAARVANIGFFMLGTASLWYGTYRLARRPEAQPMQLAFGGQPEPRDYGRMLADGALLIYLGCLGLLIHTHETKAEALLVSLVALLFYACVRYAGKPSLRNAALIGAVLGSMALTRSWILPLVLWINLVVFFCWLQENLATTIKHLASALVIAIVLTALWLLPACWLHPLNQTPFITWMAWNFAQVGWPNLATTIYFSKNGLWFFWPAWPFAFWAVYAWRRQRRDLHILLPLSFAIVLAVLAFFSRTGEESAMLVILPAMAVLASFGLPTMRRGAINAVDWFSVMALTACAAFVWIGWIALKTGWPPRMVKNIAKFAPGFTPEFNLIAFVVAGCATLGWFMIVYWRISRQPKVIWRAVVLSSGGIILLWLLLTTLWLPWINYSKSYAGIAEEMARKLPSPNACVQTQVGRAQRASFAYLGGIHFARTEDEPCNFLLLQDRVTRDPRKHDPIILPPPDGGDWQLLWEGSRPAERHEHFRLYQKK